MNQISKTDALKLGELTTKIAEADKALALIRGTGAASFATTAREQALVDERNRLISERMALVGRYAGALG